MFDACENSCSENSLILAKAAHIIRAELFSNSTSFDGDLSKEKQNESIPFCLQQFMELLIEGCSSKSFATKDIASNIGQLLKFNALKTKRRKVDAPTRHSKQLETPLPVAIGLFLHNSTRQRTLVDFFAKKGLSITHKRVDDIEGQITSIRCREYQQLGFVCPPTLEKNFFTTTAIDNIDTNYTSSTALKSFHGTTLSIFQHTTPQKPFSKNPIKLNLSGSLENFFCLPDSYTDLKPTTECKIDPPLQGHYEFALESCDEVVITYAIARS